MIALLAASFTFVSVSADTWDGETVASAYGGGTGTAEDPYLISTGAELAFLAADTLAGNSNGKYYKLTADINLNGKPWTAIGGKDNLAFGGHFDGDGHTVSGLHSDCDIMNSDIVGGLFGWTNGAFFENLTVEGSLVRGRYAGPLLAKGTATSVINCHANVDVVDGITFGGVIGRIDGGNEKNVVTYCTSRSTIVQNTTRNNASYFIGGIIGCAGNTDISYCANFGNITISREYGNATAEAANVTSKDMEVGGIIGCVGASSVTANISYCYNTGNITGYDTVTTATEKAFAGGIAAKVSHVSGTVINACYSTGVITWPKEMGGTVVGDRVGGLFGSIANAATLTYCYSTETLLCGLDARTDEQKVNDKDILSLTIDKMQGADALKNMNLGTSLSAVLDTALSNAMANANYFPWQLEAMEEYTGGKALNEYIEAYVRGEFNLTEGAELWTVNANATPSLGNLDAILVSAEIPTKTGGLVNAKLDELWAQYEADPAHTTEEEEEVTKDPTDTTAGRVTVVVGKDTTKKPVSTNAPTDNTTKESGCAGFTATVAAAFVSICALAVLVVVKKK